MSRRVWTTGRKIWGNVAPLLVALPFVLAGVWRSVQLQNPLHWSALAWHAAGIAAAWIGVGLFGLSGNRKMRLALHRRYASESHDADEGKWFVGIATPAFRSLWDPHEDVGFLSWPSTSLRFEGDAKNFTVPRESVRSIGRSRSVHSWLGLGGWVVVDGQIDGKPIRLLVESREASTLWANRKLLPKLHSELEAWRRGSAAPAGRKPEA